MINDYITRKRFWDKVDIGYNDECWDWQSVVNNTGYGRFKLDRRYQLSHRVSYMIVFGNIPPGLLCCHKCDRPICVNPYHLFLGTHKDNTKDMLKKKRQRKRR